MGHETELFYHTRAGITDNTPCECGRSARRDLVYRIRSYGTTLYHDKGLADASEAAGRPITSTKEVDALEKAGFMRAITCPSQHRNYKATTERAKRMAKLKEYKRKGLA